MPNHIHERRGGFHIRPSISAKNDTGAEIDSAPTLPTAQLIVFTDIKLTTQKNLT